MKHAAHSQRTRDASRCRRLLCHVLFRSLITQSAALAEELRAHGKGEPPASQLRAIAAKPKHPVTGEPFGGLIFPPEIGAI